MVSCLLGFIFSEKANCVTGQYRVGRYGNKFVTSIVVKNLGFDQHGKRCKKVDDFPLVDVKIR